MSPRLNSSCFLFPGESFFSAALEQDRTLIEDAIEKRVVLASPTTLIALLRAIAYGWKQQLVAENAERIKELGKELYDRVVKFAEHLSEIAKGLERANKAYNNAVASFDSRLIPSARKFREMGVGSAEVPASRARRNVSPPAAFHSQFRRTMMDFSGAGFSLWGLVLASTETAQARSTAPAETRACRSAYENCMSCVNLLDQLCDQAPQALAVARLHVDEFNAGSCRRNVAHDGGGLDLAQPVLEFPVAWSRQAPGA